MSRVDALELAVNEFLPAPQAGLFSQPAFFRLHAMSDATDALLQLHDIETGRVEGSLVLAEVAPGEWRSPRRGTYGGIDMAAPYRLEVIDALVENALDWLRNRGARRLTVLVPPLCHDAHLGALVFNSLARHGLTEVSQELDYFRSVGGEAFEDRIDRGNAKQLRKAERAGLEAGTEPASECESAFAVIVANRQSRGYPVTSDWSSIRKMLEVLPERFRIFGVREGGALIAAAICLVVAEKVLYVWYWGEMPGSEHLSPVTMLARRIYNHCQESGFGIMDVGTATLDGQPNPGLMRYKSNLGCAPSLKLSFAGSLA